MSFEESEKWKKLVKGKWLIFDADAIISILSFEAQDILELFKKLGVSNCYIHPVLLEVMNTNSPKEKLQRTELLDMYDFAALNLTASEIKLADQIQKSLPLKSQPSSTDLYLGGTLARYASSNNTFLLTSNTKDFPKPIYTREGFIVLHNDKEVKCISIIGLNKDKLV